MSNDLAEIVEQISAFFINYSSARILLYAFFLLVVLPFIIHLIKMRREEENEYIYYDFEDLDDDDDCRASVPMKIEMGDCKVFPVCPHCKKMVKTVLLVENNGESEDFEPGSLELKLCGNCHSILDSNFLD